MSSSRVLKSFLKFVSPLSLGGIPKLNFIVYGNHLRHKEIRFLTSSKRIPPNHLEAKSNPIDDAEKFDLSDFGSVVIPSFNFAALADTSPLLQKFITLGVNLYEIEKKPGADYILTLKWENIEKYLLFLTENGVNSDKLGVFITQNPFIFKESLEDLQIRINYLESKKFNKEMIANIIMRNPKWLSVPVKTIDERLGYLQQSFNFKGDNIRQIIVSSPSLGTIAKKKLMMNIYTLKEELYLDESTARRVILSVPSLLRKNPLELIETYDYLTKTMNVPLDLILKQPKILTCRKFLLVERHLFLQSLGRAQYNHLLPGYICILDFINTTDEEFCEKIAKSSLKCFDEFLKTL